MDSAATTLIAVPTAMLFAAFALRVARGRRDHARPGRGAACAVTGAGGDAGMWSGSPSSDAAPGADWTGGGGDCGGGGAGGGWDAGGDARGGDGGGGGGD